MIYELLKEKNLATILSNDLRSIPKYSNREAWENLPGNVKQYFKTEAEKLKGNQFISLPATMYMNFTRNGDRSKYESVYFERRENLMALTIAECIDASGEYIDTIIDLIWAVCEETSWVVPAHNNKGELPDIEFETFVDLFSAETGSAISFVYYFLGDIINQHSPTVKRRMEIEIDKRILTPYLKYNHFWYMGFTERAVNNWNPWINSNVLIAFAVFEKDKARLLQRIEKTAKSSDVFINSYNSDGACDEGPGYFGAAGAALFDYLEILLDITNGEINIFGEELIKNMARYIYRVYIGKDYYVNFADGPARPGAPAKLLARIGEYISDGNLIGFTNEILSKSNNKNLRAPSFHIYRELKSLFQKDYTGKNFVPPKVHWFDGTEILIARDNEGSQSGMFLSAKGGHNEESHNHNDIGHFILYFNENPVIIDAGVGTYTKQTFSGERYNIWTMQSCYHNLPAMNGFDQIAGKEYHADDVNYTHENNITKLSMQLKTAYPENAGIESYIREFIFEHGKSLVIQDQYLLKQCDAPFVFHLLCANKPIISEISKISETNANIIQLSEDIKMTFSNSDFSIDIDEIELTDARLKRDWQRDYLYRIRLIEKEMKTKNDITVCFEIL